MYAQVCIYIPTYVTYLISTDEESKTHIVIEILLKTSNKGRIEVDSKTHALSTVPGCKS